MAISDKNRVRKLRLEESEALRSIEDFKHNTLQRLLDETTPGQQDTFFRMYGTLDAAQIPDDKFEWALLQCERTVKKNKSQSTVTEEAK